MSAFLPEGWLIDTPENKYYLKNIGALEEAMNKQLILEARAIVCDNEHNLTVDLGFARATIPKLEGAVGIDDGSVRDIALISRVNKPVCFVVTDIRIQDGRPQILLSRKQAQKMCLEEYISKLVPGDIVRARVTHLESFGCFIDIGCGIVSLIPIDSISVSRISHPSDRFTTSQDIFAIVKSIDEKGRLLFSHKELLGTWEENAAMFYSGETVAGIIRSVEDYGIFIELTPNLAGLAEPKENVFPGQQASVYIKSLVEDKMKIKLIIVDAFNAEYTNRDPMYFVTSGHMDRWVYSPESSAKKIETIFTPSETLEN